MKSRLPLKSHLLGEKSSCSEGMSAEKGFHRHTFFSFRLNLFYEEGISAASYQNSPFIGLQYRPWLGIAFFMQDFRAEKT